MFDERPDIQERLDGELVAWMTTVDAAGQPQTSPVWFLVQDEVIVVYSLSRTPRTRNIAANPKVCLNLNSTPSGGEVVIIEGIAEIVGERAARRPGRALRGQVQGAHGRPGHDTRVVRRRLSRAHPHPADTAARIMSSRPMRPIVDEELEAYAARHTTPSSSSCGRSPRPRPPGAITPIS